MDELEKVRGQALGKKADPAYLEKFPIKGPDFTAASGD